MKKILLLLLCVVLVLSGCGKGSDKKTGNSSKKQNSGSSSAQSSDNEDSSSAQSSQNADSSETESDISFDTDTTWDDTESERELTVSATVEPAVKKEILPPENCADLLDPQISVETGGNAQSLAKRNAIVNSADNISVKGTVYYVSPDGDDANDGKSQSSPFETLSYATGAASAGDAVLLKRGSVFRVSSGVTLKNGVTYAAYGTGAKPEIWGSIENYAQAARWNPFTIRNVWMLDFSRSDIGIIVFNHGELVGDMKFYVRNLKKNGDYFFDDVQKMLYVYCDKGNPGKAFYDIEIGVRAILFRLRDGAQNVKIDNLSFKYTGTFAIHGSMGCRNIDITNCSVGWIGGSLFEDGSNRYGNGIEFTAGCSNLTVENCWIYQVYDAGFTFQITTDDEGEDSRTYKNINLKNNLIEYCSWAFEWWPTDKKCTVSNINVTGNIMRLSGYGWAGSVRNPAHIRGPWIGIDFITDKFFVSGNIFDCSNGPVYAWPWYNKTQPGHSLTGNTYYQKAPTASKKEVFDIGYGTPAVYATNQKELEAAVKTVDKNAALVKWLG